MMDDGILSKEELVELEKIQQAVSDDNEYMQDGGSTYYDLDAERMFDQRYKLLCLLKKALQHPDAQTAVAISTTPAEKECRAGEWVPTTGVKYYFVDSTGEIDWNTWNGDTIDNYRLSQGNVYPTEAIAEAAKKHAEFWRAFDMADEGGKVRVWSWTTGELHVSANDSIDSNPRWKTVESARAWVNSYGGEAYVSAMLTKGRVFRFKWGGE